jgi:hypothetical protein
LGIHEWEQDIYIGFSQPFIYSAGFVFIPDGAGGAGDVNNNRFAGRRGGRCHRHQDRGCVLAVLVLGQNPAVNYPLQKSSLLVFNRVYRLEIQSVMLVFSTPLVNLRPSTFSPVHTPTLPCVNKYRTIHSASVVEDGGRDPTDKQPPPSIFTGKFLRNPTFRVWVSLKIFGPWEEPSVKVQE